MSGTDNGHATYSCQCLNVQLTLSSPPEDSEPPTREEVGYDAVYVGEEGIDIKYVRAVLRSKTKEWTSVTCLLCGVLVYRVKPDKNTQVEVTDDNPYSTEPYILQSADGWIYFQKERCLRSDDIIRRSRSKDFSDVLHVALQRQKSRPSSSPSRSAPQFSSLPLPSPLPELPQFIRAPPFTPSHPVYQTFAATASKKSKDLREAAEESIIAYTKKQLDQLEEDEAGLRAEVDLLWATFKKGYEKATSPNSQARDVPSAGQSNDTALSTTPSSNDFPITPVSPRSRAIPNIPGKSALSSSLATSGMYYVPPTPHSFPSPLELQENIKDPRYGNTSALRDQAMSMRLYESELSEARAKAQDRVSQVINVTPERKQPRRQRTPQSAPTLSAFRRSPVDQDETDRKGKRKVTFEPKPKVVTINRHVKGDTESESELNKSSGGEEVSVFDFDDVEDSSLKPPATITKSAPIVFMPLRQKRRSSSPYNVGSAPHSYFESTFAQLRPESLPTFNQSVPARLRTLNVNTSALPPAGSSAVTANVTGGKGNEIGGSGEGSERMIQGTPIAQSPDSDASDEADSDLDYLELDRQEDLSDIPAMATSAPINTIPVWRASRYGSRSFQPLAALSEHGALPDWPGLNQSSPSMAKSFSQHVNNVIRDAASEGIPKKQETVRERLYDEADQVRQVDPGLDIDVGRDDASATDDEEATLSPASPNSQSASTPVAGKGYRNAKRILDKTQQDVSEGDAWRSVQ